MSERYRITAPVTTYSGLVGESIQFNKGVYEGTVPEAALLYFEQAGYGVESLDDAAVEDGNGLPAKSATRPEWEQAGIDVGLTQDEVEAAANKNELITLVTDAHAAHTNGVSQ